MRKIIVYKPYIKQLYDYTKNHQLLLFHNVRTLKKFFNSYLVPNILIKIYSIGYPYVIYRVNIRRKNIIDKFIIDDLLKIILMCCLDQNQTNCQSKKQQVNIMGCLGQRFYNKKSITRVELVCKKWNNITKYLL